jgi:adenylate cyclase class IV
MIEVEKKFSLNEIQEAKLIDSAVFDSEIIIKDSYYDKPNYELTTKSFWLRNRNGKFELKTPSGNNAERGTDHYHEITTDEEIKSILNLPIDTPLETALSTTGYSSFCSFQTTRRKYKNGDFNIDIDLVDYGDNFLYQVAEIEIIAKDDKAKEAEEAIINFAKKLDLDFKIVRGKVINYLFNKKPEHYKTLELAGVLRKYEG